MEIIDFIFSVFRSVYSFLSNNSYLGISFVAWSIAFITTGIAISAFWKGARG